LQALAVRQQRGEGGDLVLRAQATAQGQRGDRPGGQGQDQGDDEAGQHLAAEGPVSGHGCSLPVWSGWIAAMGRVRPVTVHTGPAGSTTAHGESAGTTSTGIRTWPSVRSQANATGSGLSARTKQPGGSDSPAPATPSRAARS